MLILLMLLMLLVATNLKAQSAETVTVSISDNILNLALSNTTKYCAFQMDIALPKDITVNKVEPVVDRLCQTESDVKLGCGNFIVSSRMLDDDGTDTQTLRVVAYNLANDVIAGTGGNLLKITLSDVPAMPTSVTVTGIEFVTKNPIMAATLADFPTLGGYGYTVSLTTISAEQVSSLLTGTTLDLTNTTSFIVENSNDGECSNEVTVIYHRTVPAGVHWGTLCLPASVSTTNEIQLYTVTAISENAVTISPIDHLEAGEPGLYYLKKGGDIAIETSGVLKSVQTSAFLVGVMTQKTVTDANTYYLKDNQFKSINENFNIAAFRAYLKINTAPVKSINLNICEELNPDITHVSAIPNSNGGTFIKGIYNSQGSALAVPRKGLNILRLSDGTILKMIQK